MADIVQAVLFFACLWTETESINFQNRTRPVSNHFDRTSLINREFLIWLSGKLFLRDTTAGKIASSCPLG